MKIFFIEGNIGTGKTSFLNQLIKSNYFQSVFPDKKITYLLEPVDEWLNFKDNDGKNALDSFYKDKEKFSFSFQWLVFMTRMKKILNNMEYDILVVERSIFTDRNIFAQSLFESNKMSSLEWNIYTNWFDWLVEKYNFPQATFIYLRANPEVSFNRIMNRGRNEEKSIEYDYIKLLSEKHDNWLLNNPNSIILDYNNNFEKIDDIKFFNQYFEKIKDYVSNLM